MITCPNMSRHMPRGMCGSRRHSVVKFCISKLIKITQLSRTCACARAVTRGRAFRGTPCSISLPHTTPTVEPCLHTPGLPIPSRNIAARAHPPYNQKYHFPAGAASLNHAMSPRHEQYIGYVYVRDGYARDGKCTIYGFHTFMCTNNDAYPEIKRWRCLSRARRLFMV